VIFGNPVENTLYVDLQGVFMYEVLDLHGKIVFAGQSVDGEVSVSSLPSGAYFLRINRNGEHYNLKFEKK